MKTAVSIPDKLFEQADQLARRMRKSRSQVVSEALGEYVARHDPEAVTAALDRVAEDLGQTGDQFTAAAARGVLEHTDW